MSGLDIKLTQPQTEAFLSKSKHTAIVAGFGCLNGKTKVFTKNGLIPISQITSPTQVLSWSEKDQKFVFALTGGAFPKGYGEMYHIINEQGSFKANKNHYILSHNGYIKSSSLTKGDDILCFNYFWMDSQKLDNYFKSLKILKYSENDKNNLTNYANKARKYGEELFLKHNTHNDKDLPSIKHYSNILNKNSSHLFKNKIIEVFQIEDNVYYDMQVLETNNYVTEDGTIHHNSGKTALLKTIAVHALMEHRQNIAFYEPTHSLVTTIAYDAVCNGLAEAGIPYSLNKSEGIARTPIGNVFFRSMNNPSRIVGYETCISLADEMDTLPLQHGIDVYNKIAARTRLPSKNPKYKDIDVNKNYVASTPEGYLSLYHLFKKPDTKLSDSKLIQMSTYSNPYLPKEYVDSLKSQYPEALCKAYLMGEFVNLKAGRVYDSFKLEEHVVPQTFPTKTEEIHIGQDFNVERMASAIFVRRKNKEGEIVWLVIDEIMQGKNTPDVISKIKERYVRNPIIMYPDATGARKQSSSMSKSDHSILRDAGFTLRANKTNPLVKDRVLSVNNAFEKGKLFVSEGCRGVIETLEQQVYDKDGYPSSDNDLDHIGDATGYFISYMCPVYNSSIRYNYIKHI